MIRNDEDMKAAQEAILNLQKVLLESRRVHLEEEYRAMSEPILLEIQQREQEILSYLSENKSNISVA